MSNSKHPLSTAFPVVVRDCYIIYGSKLLHFCDVHTSIRDLERSTAINDQMSSPIAMDDDAQHPAATNTQEQTPLHHGWHSTNLPAELMDLSVELRLRIYRLLLPDVKSDRSRGFPRRDGQSRNGVRTYASNGLCLHAGDSFWMLPFPRIDDSDDPSDDDFEPTPTSGCSTQVLRTSSTIYREATDHLYGRGTSGVEICCHASCRENAMWLFGETVANDGESSSPRYYARCHMCRSSTCLLPPTARRLMFATPTIS